MNHFISTGIYCLTYVICNTVSIVSLPFIYLYCCIRSALSVSEEICMQTVIRSALTIQRKEHKDEQSEINNKE